MIITLVFCSLYNSYVRLGDCVLVLIRTLSYPDCGAHCSRQVAPESWSTIGAVQGARQESL